MTLRENIQRSLRVECKTDFLWLMTPRPIHRRTHADAQREERVREWLFKQPYGLAHRQLWKRACAMGFYSEASIGSSIFDGLIAMRPMPRKQLKEAA